MVLRSSLRNMGTHNFKLLLISKETQKKVIKDPALTKELDFLQRQTKDKLTSLPQH